MKTIAELASEHGVHRTTLNKAAERGAIPFRKSGSILLIDDESEQFKQWLQSRKRDNMSSNYYSPNRAKMARRIMKLRREGYDRADIVALLESDGHPNEWVLVNSIFDAPRPSTQTGRAKMKESDSE